MQISLTCLSWVIYAELATISNAVKFLLIAELFDGRQREPARGPLLQENTAAQEVCMNGYGFCFLRLQENSRRFASCC